MIRTTLAAAFAALALAAPGQAGDAVMRVPVNEMAPLRVHADWASIVVGNPLIADVTAYDEKLLLVTGKAFGATNMMGLDADGRVLFSRRIVVSAGDPAQLIVHRGASRRTYTCADGCEASPAPGDESEFFEQVVEGRTRLSDAARSAAETAN